MSKLINIGQSDKKDRRADIIFLHGLDGNAISTWDSGIKNGSSWPDWLYEDFPGTGIWLLDYDSASLAWKDSGMPLLSRAANCFDLLEVHDLGIRPTIFITHSLGGLLAKQLLRYAIDSGRPTLSKFTKGIVFLATPHTGSKVASWVDGLGSYLPLRPNAILKNLRANDAALIDLNQWYRNHAEKLGVQTKCFYEESRTKGAITVVDRGPADPGIPDVHPIPLDADHISICKPTSKSDHVYLSVNKFLLTCFRQTDGRDEPDPAILFRMPEFAGVIGRPKLKQKLLTELAEHSVVCVGGISGCGKTYLVAETLQDSLCSKSIQKVYWHDPTSEETLDSVLLDFSNILSFNSQSTSGKCKELLAFLNKTNSILVIDDYHLTDRASYATLEQLAITWSGCARLLLITQELIDAVAVDSMASHLSIRGFDSTEGQEYLASRGLEGIEQVILEELVAKTGGLPLAFSLFAALVRNYARNPSNLLKGDLERTKRLRQWFDQVLDSVSNSSRELLQRLSLCNRPFNIGVVKSLLNDLPTKTRLGAFDALQESYLVQNYSPYRWKVHDLISIMISDEIREDVTNQTHTGLGKYFERKIERCSGMSLTEDQRIWKVRALRHFLHAPNSHDSVDRILTQIAASIKANGLYALYTELANPVLQSGRSHQLWIDYHHAHCCLILGRTNESLRVLEPLVFGDISDNVLRLHVARLYAETLHEMGSTREAISTLEDVLTAVSEEKRSVLVRQQAKSVLGGLLTDLGNFDAAERVLNEVRSEAKRCKSRRGIAVVLARLANLNLKKGKINEVESAAAAAEEIFRDIGDRRGTAWTLSILAENKLASDNESGATLALKECASIRKDIDESNREYAEQLQRMSTMARNPKMISLLNQEISRLANRIHRVERQSL